MTTRPSARATLPTGTVTVLFTDIEGSTRLGDAAYQIAWDDGLGLSVDDAVALALETPVSTGPVA